MNNSLKGFLLLLALIVLAVGACEDERYRGHQEEVRDEVGILQYTKDARTGLCFAHGWSGSDHGGPLFTNVPCSAIPPQLLNTTAIRQP